MDTSEYMPMFLAEAQEHLQQLNLAVVALEEDPRNQETVDAIFRIAHSIKGMSATMGFVAIAELTHVMEDVFELLRQRTKGLSKRAITTVLSCLDALEETLNSIESTGAENLDPAPLIAELQALIRERTPEQAVERAGGSLLPDQAALDAAREAGARIVHVHVKLAPEVMMPAVRAHMVFAALADFGELIGSVPAPDAIENFDGHELHAWLATERDEADIAHGATRVSDVSTVETDELDENAAVSPDPIADPAALGPIVEEHDAEPETRGDGKPDGAVARRTGPQSSARTVRVDAERLDTLMHLMGELVIHRTAVEAHAGGIHSPELNHAVQNLTRSSQALQQMVMQVRMIPIEVVFMRFPRLLRDLSTQLGKVIELDLVGRETELDRTVVDSIGDPLMHLIRNSLDHGIEPPDVRIAAGKPRAGRLTISARHAGASVAIEVSDDGRGVDPHAVARKALARGLIDASAAEQIDMRGAIELLFSPGFSTLDHTSEVSGRGVGMDAVRAKIRELGGEVLMESVPGQGTTSQIRLPLTLAIVSALQVDIAGAPFAIPIDRVERTLRLDERVSHSVAGRRVLSLDDGIVPLLAGAEAFGRRPTGAREDLAVIVRGDDKRVGLIVDDVTGQVELVTRPLPPIVSAGQPVSGGAVLSDGQIALIIDCDELAADLRSTGRQTFDPGGSGDTSLHGYAAGRAA